MAFSCLHVSDRIPRRYDATEVSRPRHDIADHKLLGYKGITSEQNTSEAQVHRAVLSRHGSGASNSAPLRSAYSLYLLLHCSVSRSLSPVPATKMRGQLCGARRSCGPPSENRPQHDFKTTYVTSGSPMCVWQNVSTSNQTQNRLEVKPRRDASAGQREIGRRTPREDTPASPRSAS